MILEHGDGAGMLPVLLQGRDELAEHRRGLRRQVQRPGQRTDRQVPGPALQARITEVIQHPHIPWARAALGVCHRRRGPGQVLEPGQPCGLSDQPCHLTQRQIPAPHAQKPQQTRDVPGRQQALRLLEFPSHAPHANQAPARAAMAQPDGISSPPAPAD